MTEACESFDCFGATCTVLVGGAGGQEMAEAARDLLLAWHDRFTRFDPDSELSRLNADRRATIPVTPMMARLAAAVADAAELTGGLVDGTLVERSRTRATVPTCAPLDLPTALGLAPPRRAAAPREPLPRLSIDFHALVLCRPPGVRIDGGGLAKGLFADVVAETLAGRTFAIDCAGDVRVGGDARRVDVQCPFDGRTLHHFELARRGRGDERHRPAQLARRARRARRTTCSTPPPAGPRSPASCRRPRSRRPRSRPRCAPRPRS